MLESLMLRPSSSVSVSVVVTVGVLLPLYSVFWSSYVVWRVLPRRLWSVWRFWMPWDVDGEACAGELNGHTFVRKPLMV